MNNPYEDILPAEQVTIGRKAAWSVAIIFLLCLVVPPIVANVKSVFAGDDEAWVPVVEFARSLQPETSSPPGSSGIAQRLRGFESRLEQNSNFAEQLRRSMQRHLTGIFREGNNRTVIGRDGWLYFRPALHALAGYGPILSEPQSVTKDPTRPLWNPAVDAIRRFALQLEERGIELVLVPAPVKPMIYPEYLTGTTTSGPVRHRDSDSFYGTVRESGCAVIDIADTFWEMKNEDATKGPLFLKQDTHWRPRGMMAAVDAVAKYLAARPWFQQLPESTVSLRTEVVESKHVGDLVEKLDLPMAGDLFSEELATLTRVLDAETGQSVASDRESPIVVLGDSFVNVFDDPSLGFAVGSPPREEVDAGRCSAGFAQHLAMRLKRSLDVIAVNGEASTGVRAQFARRSDDEVRAKKAVIWVIAARDLFLSETPATDLVRWDDVVFNSTQKPVKPEHASNQQQIIVVGKVTMKSAITNPREVAYKNALYTIDLQIDEIESGALPRIGQDSPLRVVLWAFKNREYQPESNLKVGEQIRVRLVPHETKPELETTRIFDDSLDFVDQQWFAEEVF